MHFVHEALQQARQVHSGHPWSHRSSLMSLPLSVSRAATILAARAVYFEHHAVLPHANPLFLLIVIFVIIDIFQAITPTVDIFHTRTASTTPRVLTLTTRTRSTSA